MSRRLAAWIVLAALVAGTVYTISMASREHRIVDVDEAAWVFNGRFLDLYLSGDWDPAKWREFDAYAQHPPAGKYLFGALMHAIGEPIRSMEPRRYWFENDYYATIDLEKFLAGLRKRLTPRQLMAGRLMAAAFAALSALLFFALARGLFGTWPALAGYAILVTHPMFRVSAEIATADSFFLALALSSVLISMKLGRACAGPARPVAAWAAALAVALGLSFSTKILAFAFVVPCAFCAALASAGSKSRARALLLVLAAFAAGIAISCLIDPGLHGDLLGQLQHRFAMRLERVEIQEIVFTSARLGNAFDRFCFFFGHLFFSSRIDIVLFAPLFASGILAPALLSRGKGRRTAAWTAIALAAFFCLLTLVTLPLAFTRYLSLATPYFVLVGAAGVAALMETLCVWDFRSNALRKGLLAYLLSIAFCVALINQWIGPAYCKVPRGATPEDDFIARLFAYNLLEPCKRPNINKILYEQFKRTGDEKWAARQLICIEKLPKKP